MSYDAWMEIDTGGESPTQLDGCEWLGLTWNLSPMLKLALGVRVTELNLETGAGVAPLLAVALERMTAEPDAYREHNPPNGWGSYEDALRFIETLLSWCKAHPRATLRVTA